MSPFAPIYWRRIKALAKSFITIPDETVKDNVKQLAKEDVSSGKISSDQYAELIGETYAP